MKIKGQTMCKVLDNVLLSMSMNFIFLTTKKHQASNHNRICLRRKVESDTHGVSLALSACCNTLILEKDYAQWDIIRHLVS